MHSTILCSLPFFTLISTFPSFSYGNNGTGGQPVPKKGRKLVQWKINYAEKPMDQMTEQEIQDMETAYEKFKEERPMPKPAPLEDRRTQWSTCYLKVTSANGQFTRTCAGKLFFLKEDNSIAAIGKAGRKESGIITSADCYFPNVMPKTTQDWLKYQIKPDQSGKWLNFEGTVRFACNTPNTNAAHEITLNIGAHNNLVRIHPGATNELSNRVRFNNLAILVLPHECHNLVAAVSPHNTVFEYLKPFKHPFTNAHPSNSCKVLGFDSFGNTVQQKLTRAYQDTCYKIMPGPVTRSLFNKLAVCLEVDHANLEPLTHPGITWGPVMCLLGLGIRWETTGFGVSIVHPPNSNSFPIFAFDAPSRPLIASPLIENTDFIFDALFAPISNFAPQTCLSLMLALKPVSPQPEIVSAKKRSRDDDAPKAKRVRVGFDMGETKVHVFERQEESGMDTDSN